MAASVFELNAIKNDGSMVNFSQFKGKTLLVVNTASKCGFTPQYKGLEALHEELGSKGLVVLGFPCDQFAHQEPGSDEEIAQFCSKNFGVTFPLMQKVDVNGKNTHPVFEFVKEKAPGIIGKSVKWNFTKFLVRADGTTVTRYDSRTTPESMHDEVAKAVEEDARARAAGQ